MTNHKTKHKIYSSVISSIIEVSIVHPLDVYKTILQQNNTYTFTDFLRSNIRYKYRGYLSRLFGIIPMRTTFWLSQDIIGKYIETHYKHTMSNTLKYIYVGGVASYLQTIIDTPIENIKINTINRRPPITKYIMNGFSANYSRNFVFATILYSSNRLGDTHDLNKFFTGSLGGVCGSILSQPIDFIKTNKQSNPRRTYSEIILNKHFINNCMNGCVARSSISFMSMGIGSFTYYYMKSLL